MNESYLDLLSKVENLKWIPWVGHEYSSLDSKNRLLIIGESHYHDNTMESIEKHNVPTFTREVIEELAIDRNYYGTKIFPNLHRALFRNDEFDSSVFWNLISFYNFIQKPMDTNKGRPNYDDFHKSWYPFLEIIKIIKPNICLFIGTSAANSLENAISTTDYKTDGVVWEDFISNAYAKSAIIKDINGIETKLIFIRHTSQMFSWRNWNGYLTKKIPNELAWLESKLIYNKK